jgi:uncharacterized protein
MKGHFEISTLLLESGANPHLHSEVYGSVLMAAVDQGDVAMISMLLAAGVNLDVEDVEGYTALINAAIIGYT